MAEKIDWTGVICALGRGFSEKTAEHDATDTFVTESYAALQSNGVFAAGVPAELGGGGASHADLCEMIREVAHHCSSTALALSMHTHLVASMAYIWRSGNKAMEPLLHRVATEGLILVTSGASDWLTGSGQFEKVDGGYRLTGRKRLLQWRSGGSRAADDGVYDDPQAGPIVVHVPLALDAPGVSVLDTWHVLGMRGTGSNDIQLEDVFIPDAAMSGVRRPAGKWHPFVHIVTLIVLPLIYAAYRGIAETARRPRNRDGKEQKERPERGVHRRRDGEPACHGPTRPRESYRAGNVIATRPGDDQRRPDPTDHSHERRHADGRKGDGGGWRRGILPERQLTRGCSVTSRAPAITCCRKSRRRATRGGYYWASISTRSLGRRIPDLSRLIW